MFASSFPVRLCNSIFIYRNLGYFFGSLNEDKNSEMLKENKIK